MRDRIFVSVAAYRDPELARTVRDLLSRAARPQALTVAVFEQSEKAMARPERPRGTRLLLEHCHPNESQGVCWARARIQSRLNGEDYYLQLDSHHLFKPGWDALLLAEFAACPAPRVVLTGYLPPYELRRGRPRINAAAATPMHFSHFDHDGVIIYRSHSYEREVPTPPIPARFFSGHFAFARREFVECVPYDPELYFYGEESSMAVRAFTHGFDLFHPGRTIAWHHYVRQGKPHHWDDHPPEKAPGASWIDLQRRGLAKYRRIFCLMPHVDQRDGLGARRSLADYEAWAGVDHYRQLIHLATATMQPPPAAASPNWAVTEGLLKETELTVDLPLLASIDARPCSEIHVAIIDSSSRDAFARRFSPAEYDGIQKTKWNVRVQYRALPLRLVVWPFIVGTGWGNKFEVHLATPLPVTADSSAPIPPKKRSPRASVRPSRPRRNRDA